MVNKFAKYLEAFLLLFSISGRPKASYFYPIADKIKTKLSAWKASLLSIAGRVQLVRSVIQSMMVYSISVYAWPIQLLKNIETWSRNFIWSGDINQKKLVTVAWKKVCTPLGEGGLGLRSLLRLNEAANLKLCWDLLLSKEDWAIILKKRVLRNGNVINHHVFSSIWSSVKTEFSTVMNNSSWKVGTGQNINLWLDSWCGGTLAQTLNVNQNVLVWLPSKVSDIIHDQKWNIPFHLELLFPTLKNIVQKVTLPVEPLEDQLCWNNDSSGVLTMKDAYDFKRLHFPVKAWAKTIWCKEVPPSKSLLVWRLMQDKIPTDDKLVERGYSLPSICSLCHICSESTFHLFFECNFAVNLWRWLAYILGKALHFQSLEDIWKFCDSSWTPQCKVAIKSAVINIMSAIWFARNNARFNNKPTHWKAAVNWIQSNVSLVGNKTSCCSYSSITDFIILKKFNVSIHPPKAPVIKEVIWHPPFGQWKILAQIQPS
ncbi:unnamed protein product [Trifolium pratense]|uniref:Uncharacterized protein n=1 Tax=Trifolium pratense TaxID=57577 RepID=A0ACB0JF56_TRIPR|nr:unnamed protein product [Trifolium pratense]